MALEDTETSTLFLKATQFITEVEIPIESENDLELHTEIGYKASVENKLFVKPVTLRTKSVQIINFECDQKPIYIQLDPFYRVPQTHPAKCSWQSQIVEKRERISG